MIDHDQHAHNGLEARRLWNSLKQRPEQGIALSLSMPSSSESSRLRRDFLETKANGGGMKFYVASKTRHAEMWKKLRARGLTVTSSWIDEAGEGETGDYKELWDRIEREVRGSDALLFYADGSDSGWKGAFFEAGIAVGHGIPIYMILDHVKLEGITDRPLGSWIRHPAVTMVSSIAQIPGYDEEVATRFHRAELTFGYGKIAVGPAIHPVTGEVSLMAHEIEGVPRVIGSSLRPDGGSVKLPVCVNHLLMHFHNAESLDGVMEGLVNVRRLLNGEVTWKELGEESKMKAVADKESVPEDCVDNPNLSADYLKNSEDRDKKFRDRFVGDWDVNDDNTKRER